MYPVDPGVLIQMIKQGNNPQQLILSILQGQAYTMHAGNTWEIKKATIITKNMMIVAWKKLHIQNMMDIVTLFAERIWKPSV